MVAPGAPEVDRFIRREYRGDTVRSKRLRSAAENEALNQSGARIATLELQGALYFGSLEKLMSRVSQIAEEADYLVIDFKRVHVIDASALRLVEPMIETMASSACRLAVTQLQESGALAPLRRVFEAAAEKNRIELFEETDNALEKYENLLLGDTTLLQAQSKLSLSQMNILAGLSVDEYRLLEREVQVFSFKPGEKMIRKGDPANIFFIIATGSVSIILHLANGRSKRVACMGPGLSVGEMALLDGGRRSADVIADEAVMCYGFSVDRIRELSVTHPNINITILGNLTRELSERLRRANAEISELE